MAATRRIAMMRLITPARMAKNPTNFILPARPPIIWFCSSVNSYRGAGVVIDCYSEGWESGNGVRHDPLFSSVVRQSDCSPLKGGPTDPAGDVTGTGVGCR